MRKLELKENATLIYHSSTTLNIQFKLKGGNKADILPGNNNLSATDLFIKYIGARPKKDKEKEDDDNEIESDLDDQEKRDHKRGVIGRPVQFGKDSFLNFKLLAPSANVKIGERTTLRGQVLGREIKVGKSSILSLATASYRITNSADIITDPDGGVYPINEILISLTPEATFNDAQRVADEINGRIIGVVSSVNWLSICN